MTERTEGEDPDPACDMSNFASWYRHMTQERQDSSSQLQNHLRQIMPGFESLDLRSAGANLRVLSARFALPPLESPANGFSFAFGELSDGQRVLICLYALLSFAVKENACLFLDEPENYVAIPEIQPWLMELSDRLEDLGGQAILISHHPEIVNYLAPEFGLVFERDGPGPVRVRNYQPDNSLSPAEQIARGW